MSERARLDAVVTVADAKWLSERLKDAPEAKNQIAFADVILLNKVDLVDEAALADVEGRIRAINPPPPSTGRRTAPSRSPRCWTARPSTSTASWRSSPSSWSPATITTTTTRSMSFSFRAGEVNPDKFMPWISELTQKEGPNILRCKGIVAFPKEPKRFVFQGVHMILDGDLQRDWSRTRSGRAASSSSAAT